MLRNTEANNASQSASLYFKSGWSLEYVRYFIYVILHDALSISRTKEIPHASFHGSEPPKCLSRSDSGTSNNTRTEGFTLKKIEVLDVRKMMRGQLQPLNLLHFLSISGKNIRNWFFSFLLLPLSSVELQNEPFTPHSLVQKLQYYTPSTHSVEGLGRINALKGSNGKWKPL